MCSAQTCRQGKRKQMSQSLLLGSITNWIPYITSQNGVHPDTWICVQENNENIARIVANLTMPVTSQFYAQQNINVFFPNVGLFVSDFALGTALCG